MRVVFVLLSVLMVVACASGNKTGPTDETGQVRAAQPGSFADDSFADESLTDEATVLGGQLTAAITPACGDMIATTQDIECVRGLLLTGFDTTGEARNHCPVTSMDEVLECIVYGSLGYGLLQRIEAPENIEFDWRSPVNSMDMVVNEIGDQNARLCLGQYPSTPEPCYRLQIAKSFGLTETDDTMCGSLDTEEWKRCIWHAFVRNEFENARLRMR